MSKTKPEFDLVDMGEYPALVRGGQTAVVGEVYQASAAMLARLDAYEGCPDLFCRERIELHAGLVAEVYLLDRKKLGPSTILVSGDWSSR